MQRPGEYFGHTSSPKSKRVKAKSKTSFDEGNIRWLLLSTLGFAFFSWSAAYLPHNRT